MGEVNVFQDLTLTKDSVIRELHWPASYPTMKFRGRCRPTNAPTVWPGVPASANPTPVGCRVSNTEEIIVW